MSLPQFPESESLEANVRMELRLWDVPEELRQKVESFEEMNQVVLAHPKFSQYKEAVEVYLRQHRNRIMLFNPFPLRHRTQKCKDVISLEGNVSKGYDIYSLRSKDANDWLLNIGHGCNECNSLRIGPPIVKPAFPNFLEKIYMCEECGIEMDCFDLRERRMGNVESASKAMKLNSSEKILTRV